MMLLRSVTSVTAVELTRDRSAISEEPIGQPNIVAVLRNVRASRSLRCHSAAPPTVIALPNSVRRVTSAVKPGVRSRPVVDVSGRSSATCTP